MVYWISVMPAKAGIQYTAPHLEADKLLFGWLNLDSRLRGNDEPDGRKEDYRVPCRIKNPVNESLG